MKLTSALRMLNSLLANHEMLFTITNEVVDGEGFIKLRGGDGVVMIDFKGDRAQEVSIPGTDIRKNPTQSNIEYLLNITGCYI